MSALTPFACRVGAHRARILTNRHPRLAHGVTKRVFVEREIDRAGSAAVRNQYVERGIVGVSIQLVVFIKPLLPRGTELLIVAIRSAVRRCWREGRFEEEQ